MDQLITRNSTWSQSISAFNPLFVHKRSSKNLAKVDRRRKHRFSLKFKLSILMQSLLESRQNGSFSFWCTFNIFLC